MMATLNAYLLYKEHYTKLRKPMSSDRSSKIISQWDPHPPTDRSTNITFYKHCIKYSI